MRCLLLPLSISLFRSLSGGNGCLIMPWAWYSGFALPVFLHKAVWRPPVEQTSPDKSVNFHCTTAAFTVSAEPRALLCCANLPADLPTGRQARPYMLFLFVSSQFCHRLPPDKTSRFCPSKNRDLRLAFG